MTQFNDSAKARYGKQDYTPKKKIEGVEIVELKRFNDDGGAMTELGRLDGGVHKQLPGFTVKQVNYSVLEPLAIKAFHLHTRQTDVWYVPPSDKLLLVLAEPFASSTSGVARAAVSSPRVRRRSRRIVALPTSRGVQFPGGLS